MGQGDLRGIQSVSGEDVDDRKGKSIQILVVALPLYDADTIIMTDTESKTNTAFAPQRWTLQSHVREVEGGIGRARWLFFEWRTTANPHLFHDHTARERLHNEYQKVENGYRMDYGVAMSQAPSMVSMNRVRDNGGGVCSSKCFPRPRRRGWGSRFPYVSFNSIQFHSVYVF